MSPHQIIAVAVRLFAIWLAIFVVGWLPGFIREISEAQNPQVAIVVYAVFAAIIGFMAYLWFFPRTVAHKLLAPSEERPSAPASPNEYFSIGCSLIGLWILTESLPGFARYLLVLVFTARQGPNFIVNTSDLHSGGIYFAVQSLIGLLLLFGAKAIVRFVTRVRYDG